MAVFPSDSIRTKDWGNEVLTDADLEAQLDLLHTYLQACLNATSGHAHTGSSNQGPKISPANLLIASQAQGDLLYASSATSWTRLGAGTAGYLLKTGGAGANPSWVDISSDSSYLPNGTVIKSRITTDSTERSLSVSSAIPTDDSKPATSEGGAYAALETKITPASATNTLFIEVCIQTIVPAGNGAEIQATLWKDADSSILSTGAVGHADDPTVASTQQLNIFYKMTAGTTNEITFKVNIGNLATTNNVSVNVQRGGANYGSTLTSYMRVTEYKGSI